MIKPDHFSIDELVCPDVYQYYGDTAFQFFDVKLLITIDRLREKFNKPIYINNWMIHGDFTQRGFRCIKCDLVKKAIADNQIYVSPHMTGQAVDFDVEGLLSEEVRQYIIKNKNLWPYPMRLEEGVSWVHLDIRDNGTEKITLFKA